MNSKKIKFSILIIISILSFIQNYNTSEAYKKYHDNKWHNVWFTNKVDSEWNNWYCYKFNLNNDTDKNIYDWKLSFETDHDINFTSKRWFNYKKEWNKYILEWISWNKNLKRWDKNIEVWFCVNSKDKPKNIDWNDDTEDDNSFDDEFECSDYKTQSSCTNGQAKTNCTWNNNTCSKLDSPSTSTWTVDLTCNLAKDSISDINIVKNNSFEEYNEWNILKKWWNKIVNFFMKWFTAKFKDVPYWSSTNWDYKLWRDNDENPAQDKDNFIELTDLNSISQTIHTKANQKYKLSFYNIWNDELEVLWNWTSLTKENAAWAWTKKEFTVTWIDWNSSLVFKNSKQNNIVTWAYSSWNIDTSKCPTKEISTTSKVIDYDKVAQLWYIVQNWKIYQNVTTKVIDYDKATQLWYIVQNWKIYQNKTVTSSASWTYYNTNKNLSKNSTYSLNIDSNTTKIKIWYTDFIDSPSNDKNWNLKIDLINASWSIIKTINQIPFSDNCDWWNWWYCSNDDYQYYESSTAFSKVKFTTNSTADLYIDYLNIEAKQVSTIQQVEITWDAIPMKDSVSQVEVTGSAIPMKDQITTVTVPDMDKCVADDKETFVETHIRLGIDNVSLNEVTTTNQTKIDLMSLINEALLNKTKVNSCQNFLDSLWPKLREEIITRLISWASIKDISYEFYNSILETTKYDIVKNIAYNDIKDILNDCYTEEEKNAFYNKVYNLSIADIWDCTVNNLNTETKKEIANISYLQSVTNNCSISWNTITLWVLNNYSTAKK